MNLVKNEAPSTAIAATAHRVGRSICARLYRESNLLRKAPIVSNANKSLWRFLQRFKPAIASR
jgi:hypothetical protein